MKLSFALNWMNEKKNTAEDKKLIMNAFFRVIEIQANTTFHFAQSYLMLNDCSQGSIL